MGENLISSSQPSSAQPSQIIEDSGATNLTVATITTSSFEDVKSVFMDANGSAPNFVADLVLSNTLTLGGSVSMNGSNANVTGFNTTFTLDLKVGDIVTVSGAGSAGADLTAKVTNSISSNTAMVLGSNSATAVTTVPIVEKEVN